MFFNAISFTISICWSRSENVPRHPPSVHLFCFSLFFAVYCVSISMFSWPMAIFLYIDRGAKVLVCPITLVYNLVTCSAATSLLLNLFRPSGRTSQGGPLTYYCSPTFPSSQIPSSVSLMPFVIIAVKEIRKVPNNQRNPM